MIKEFNEFLTERKDELENYKDFQRLAFEFSGLDNLVELAGNQEIVKEEYPVANMEYMTGYLDYGINVELMVAFDGNVVGEKGSSSQMSESYFNGKFPVTKENTPLTEKAVKKIIENIHRVDEINKKIAELAKVSETLVEDILPRTEQLLSVNLGNASKVFLATTKEDREDKNATTLELLDETGLDDDTLELVIIEQEDIKEVIKLFMYNQYESDLLVKSGGDYCYYMDEQAIELLDEEGIDYDIDEVEVRLLAKVVEYPVLVTLFSLEILQKLKEVVAVIRTEEI